MKDRDTCQKVVVLLCIAAVVCVCWLSRVYGEAGAAINETNFPDPDFREIVDEYDQDGDGFLSEEEIANVHSLHIEDKRVESMKGIKFFTSLEELECIDISALKELDISGCTALKELYCYCNSLKDLDISECTALEKLICSDNKLTALDVSRCTALKNLDCHGAHYLTNLDVSRCATLENLDCSFSDLKSLNVSGCIALKELDCSGTYYLTDLDVSGCATLENLDCSGSALKNLNVSGCKTLKELDCSFTDLTVLDVSGCATLENLHCHGADLKNLNVSGCTALNELDCSGTDYLTDLDVSGCATLENLDCSDSALKKLNVGGCTTLENLDCNTTALTTLDISECTALEKLICSDNKLTALDISKNKALKYLDCTNTQITTLDVHNCPMLVKLIKEYTRAMISDTGYGWSATGFESYNTKPEWFYQEELCLCIDKSVAIIPAIEIKPEDMENVAINDVHFPDVPFRYKVSYYDEDQDGILSRNEREKIEIIDLSNVGPPDTLEGVEYFTALKVLRFEYASLRSLDLSKNTALEELYCNSSWLSALDLSKNTALKALHCDGNKLTSLDLSNNTALKVLHCDRNNLTSLDLSNNTALEVLSCNANKLTALDISRNTVLKSLECNKNELTVLDLNHNTALEVLSCNANKLTVLDISKHTALKSLECSDNQLSTLDVSRKEALKKIFCRNNQITALAVSDNTVLESLDCSNNQLISLDIRQNTALTELNCSDNQLTVLDTGNNADLLNLTCKHNQIKTLDVSKMASLKKLDCTQNQLKDLDVSHCPYLVTLIDKYRQCTGDETQNWDDSSEYYMDYPKFVLYTDLGVKITGEDKTGVPVDEQHFPDAGFRECIEEFDRNRNGLLSENDIKSAERMYVSRNYDVKSLKGIEFFTCLKELECTGQALTELDVSKNIALVTLDCSNSPITTLNISGNTNLAHLKCIHTKLEKLDIGTCPVLVNLINTTKSKPTDVEDTLFWGLDLDEDKKYKAQLWVDQSLEIIDSSAADRKIREYVTRCYEIILGRTPDAGGLKTWYNELTSGRKTASEIIDRFVNSPEYLSKNYNYGDSVDILYQAMLGRKADAGGKAHWVGKLENGQPFADVINGFCVSPEFKGICDTYGIRPGSVTIPEKSTTADEKIKAFVQRCYRIILNREPDEGGMKTWFDELQSHRKAASEIIDQFVNSPEFKRKELTKGDSVEILYKAMLGRGSDAPGKANWVSKLLSGQPYAAVINGFCVSPEFKAICAAYGIEPGTVKVETLSSRTEEELSMLALNAKEPITCRSETKPNRVEIINPSDTINMNIGTAVQAVYINEEKAKEFIGRCYQVILGREASEAEVETWIGQMVNGTKTPDQIARGFLFSNEFKAKNVSSEELVKILYRVYMNRDADPEGLKTWTEKLNNGTSLKDLLDTFAKTNEFRKVVSEMSK